MSGAVDSGEVLDPLSLVFKTEKTIQCVIFSWVPVSASKRLRIAIRTAFSFHFHWKSDEMDHRFGARIQLIVLFRSINLQIVRRLHVSSLIIQRSLEKSTILNRTKYWKRLLHFSVVSCCWQTDWKWNYSNSSWQTRRIMVNIIYD